MAERNWSSVSSLVRVPTYLKVALNKRNISFLDLMQLCLISYLKTVTTIRRRNIIRFASLFLQ